MYANRKKKIENLKQKLSELDEFGPIEVPPESEFYYSQPNIGIRGVIVFLLLLFTLYVTYKYISAGDTAGSLFFFILTCLLALSLKDEIVKFLSKSKLVEMNEEYIVYKSEIFKWGDIENDCIYYEIKRTPRALILTFNAKGKNHNICISELEISEHEFNYMYYTYKLRYLEKHEH